MFVAWHRGLVELRWATAGVQLLRIRAGLRDIGYLSDNVCCKRVLHNAQLGHDVFDFLAGEAKCMRSLSTNEETLMWVGLHCHSTAFAVEQVLRRAKRRLCAVRAWSVN